MHIGFPRSEYLVYRKQAASGSGSKKNLAKATLESQGTVYEQFSLTFTIYCNFFAFSLVLMWRVFGCQLRLPAHSHTYKHTCAWLPHGTAMCTLHVARRTFKCTLVKGATLRMIALMALKMVC